MAFTDDETLTEIANKNVRELEHRYDSLLQKVAKILDEKKISFRIFQEYAESFFNSKEKEVLANTSSIIDVFTSLSDSKVTRWKYDSIPALEDICKHFGKGNEDLMTMINDYKSELAGFKATTKIAHYMKTMKFTESDLELDEDSKPIKQTMSKYNDKYCHKLSIKLKVRVKESCISYIEKLWTSISDELLVPKLPVLLKDICVGCIEVSWAITKRMAEAIQDHAERFQQVAEKFKIINVKLDDQVLYQVRNAATLQTTQPSHI